MLDVDATLTLLRPIEREALKLVAALNLNSERRVAVCERLRGLQLIQRHRWAPTQGLRL